MANKIHLLVIDPQFDFCDPTGALYVRGAEQDMERLARMVRRLVDKIDDIHVTLDSHHYVDIAHPIFWVDSKGNHPDPFTIISKGDLLNGRWTTTIPGVRQRAFDYVTQLDAGKRYPLCIWPPHCIIGTKGYQIMPCFADALGEWCNKRVKVAAYITKGSNPFTEHYSAVKAEVPDSADPTTMVNTDFINTLQQADTILISGVALSHCVANSIRDVAREFGDENVKKFVLLRDTCSNVGTFESLGDAFITEMRAKGMCVMNSTEFLA